ncbi:ferredoxin--NADP reductase [Streptomyces sp. B-S-A8]|uniref:Ferredoxin--NADP reductase n=1 Tax=Streptomyces solicavernae TaxID=3043614 RepID=A0ABT6RSX4_9ACTN|nr:ferredoxin--NADP reductase [Streptomyces sp. B-S-A8]MDI3387538.1 ferredoxin--NADP reductase [Streptomyces sp. B-S-A8]
MSEPASAAQPAADVPSPRLRVRVAEVVAETADTHSLVLEPAPEDTGRFAYRPGQFLTLRLPGADGRPAARCYSLSSSPHTGEPMKVTVKRVPGGRCSNWVCDRVGPGDEIEVLAPAGTFTPDTLDDDLLLVAGGSGITPVLSIAKSALARGHGRVTLLYANRDDASVVFRDELWGLTEQYPDRLVMIHWLETLLGLPDLARLSAALAPYAGRDAFLCGPAPLMDAAEQALRAAGTPAARVHRERFFSLSGDVFDTPAPAAVVADPAAAVRTAHVALDDETHTVDWPSGQPLLDALLAAGVDAPYSCREGACAACACRVVGGEVKLLRNEVLDEEDLADGYVLACQALPLTDRVEVTYS